MKKRLLATGLAISLTSACSAGEVRPQPTQEVSPTAPSAITTPCATPKQREIYAGHFAVRFTLPAGEIVDDAAAAKVTDDAAHTIWQYSMPGSLGLKAYNLQADSVVSHVIASGTRAQYEAAAASDPNIPTNPMWLLVQTENMAILDTTITFPAPRPLYTTEPAVTFTERAPYLPPATETQGYIGIIVTANEACSVNPSSL